MPRTLLLALALALAACGSDDAADAPPSLSDTAEAIEPMPPASSAPSSPSVSGATVVDRIAEAGDLMTLRRLLREYGVADELAAEGPFTIFAPSDDAFAAAGDLPTDPEVVRGLLLSHALPFRITAVDMDFEQTVETIGGSRVTISPGQPPTVSSGASAAIARPDLDASNGVVHVIDSVLL